MTMTPERLAEIRHQLEMWKPHVRASVGSAFEDLLADHTALTAEIATLRTQLESLRTAGKAITLGWEWDGEITQEQLDALSAAVREAKGEE